MSVITKTREDVERIAREAREGGRRPYLCGSNLSGLDLFGIDLHKSYLSGADLSGAILRGADLSGANLNWANLSGTDLYGANLHGAIGVIELGHAPSGSSFMTPLPSGVWHLYVGCWDGTTASLRALMDGDDWPEATGLERDRRRPILAALADYADAQAAYYHHWLQYTVQRWGDKESA